MVPTPEALNSLTHFRMAQHLLFEYRIQHTLHGRFHIFDGIVDDPVQTDIHAFPLRGLLGRRIRTHIESDDDGVGSGCQADVRLVDGAYAAVDDLDYHFVVGQFQQGSA